MEPNSSTISFLFILKTVFVYAATYVTHVAECQWAALHSWYSDQAIGWMIWALIPIQISPGSHLGSYNQWVPGALFSGERSWGMKLRSHLHLVVGLRRSGGVTLLHLRAFVAWTGTS